MGWRYAIPEAMSRASWIRRGYDKPAVLDVGPGRCGDREGMDGKDERASEVEGASTWGVGGRGVVADLSGAAG